VIDPTGQTHMADLPEYSILISADAVEIKNMGRTARDTEMFKELAKKKMSGQINSQTLISFVADIGGTLGFIVGVFSFFVYLLGHFLWALIIAFLVSPLVRISAPNLRMPRQMAYRVSGSITVPLLIFGGLLELIGHPPRLVLGGEFSTLFWFFAAGAMAFWGGHLLNRHALDALRRNRGH